MHMVTNKQEGLLEETACELRSKEREELSCRDTWRSGMEGRGATEQNPVAGYARDDRGKLACVPGGVLPNNRGTKGVRAH